MNNIERIKMKKHKKGFTLVEVLLCVGIIGIIAAISIPSLLSSTSTKALETQRKALYSRMSQAFSQMKNLKNYNYGTNQYNYPALNLITNGLSKVYKVAAVCDYTNLSNCGVPDLTTDNYSDTGYITYPLKSKTTLISLNSNLETVAKWGGSDFNSAGFRTANGESILLFYNPNCKSKIEAAHSVTQSVCVNMVYDLNGKAQAPNAYGEDIGYITVFYPSEPTVVMPVLYNREAFSGTFSEMFAKAKELDLVPPTREELVSILINKDITYITNTGDNKLSPHWTSTYGSSGIDEIWTAGITDGVKKVNITADNTISNPYYLIRK